MFASAVLIGVKVGFLVAFAGSGKTMSSIICSMSASASAVCSFKLDVERFKPFVFSASLRIFINDAGVAGSPFASCKGAAWRPFCLALRYGDLLAEVDLGVAGGGIRISDNGSGETESGPELS